MSGKSENAFYPVRGKAGGIRTGGAMGTVEEVFGAKMREFTTVGIGGAADRMMFPQSSREVQTVLEPLRGSGAEPLALGAGSNLLVSDEGVRGTVLCLKRHLGKGLFSGGASVVAEAGTMLPRLARLCALSGPSGAGGPPRLPGA